VRLLSHLYDGAKPPAGLRTGGCRAPVPTG